MVISKYEMGQLNNTYILDKVLIKLDATLELEIRRALLSTAVKIETIEVINCSFRNKNIDNNISVNRINRQFTIKINIGYFKYLVDEAFDLLAKDYKKAGYKVKMVDDLVNKGFIIYI